MAAAKDTFEIEKTDVEDLMSPQEDLLKKTPPWSEQITARGLFAGLVIGILYCIIVMKLVLSTGIVPAMNVSAALLAFVLVKTWTRLLNKIGFSTQPFTKQENTIVQTCAVACYSIVQGGGFGSYLLGLNKRTYELAGEHTEGNNPRSYKDPALGWMTGFLFVTCFVGLLILFPLRKVMIIDYKLTFPNGTATAILIEGFHTSKGDKMAKKQVRGFTKFFSCSSIWGFFKWFYSRGEKCGFSQFPTFGLQAWRQTFYFDFNMTYVGAGMICPHLVNLSLLFGAVVSWGIMWPLIHGTKGKWYPDNLPESSMQSLQGYKVFIPIAILLGDGLYNFFKIFLIILRSVHLRVSGRSLKADDQQSESIDDVHRNETFTRDGIPLRIAFAGYAFFSLISIIAIPRMFPQMRWYYVFVAYIFAPVLAFCNAYGTGLTDMNLAYNYGKVALFILAAWAGKDSGVVAGLVGCGLVKSITSISADLMHDLKTGYLTLSSPRALIISQAVGTAMGCVIAPLSFFLFYKAFDVGNPEGEFKAPFAIIYRNMVILGVEGFSALPNHCLQLCIGGFFFSIAANLVKDLSPPKYGKWVPLPMAVAVPFLVGAYFAIDMFVGTVIVFVWQKLNSKRASVMIPAVASGLMCGEGLWTLPSSILALAKVNPPICMSFMRKKLL